MAKDISPDTKSKVPKHTLQDEELVVLLKALDYFTTRNYKVDEITVKEFRVASNIAKELRNKAGWEKYSKPQEEVLEIPSGLKQSCEVCDD